MQATRHDLRPATPDDADALSAFAARCFCDTFAPLYDPADLALFLAHWNQPGDFARQAISAQWAIVIAEASDGGIAGFAKLGPLDLPLPADQPDVAAIELHHLYLDRAHHGSGLAQTLMAWALDTARARGNRHLYLSVFVDNHRAQSFYRRYGFVEVGRNPYRVGNHVDDDRIWRLDL